MKKVIFIDIDGTLRNDERIVTKKTKEMIQKAMKNEFLIILCSGRPKNNIIEISKEIGASPYVISSNGSQGYDYENQKILYINPMKKEACLALYEIAKKHQVKFVMNTNEGRVVTRIDPGREDKLLEEPIEEFLEKMPVMQCLLQDGNFEIIKNLKEEIEKVENVGIKNQSKSLTNPNIKPTDTTYYDIADTLTSKGYGIKRICKILNIKREDTIAIGDDYNDISMFQEVGYSVAVGNANEEVKSYANEITKTNNEDGVACFIEKLIKRKEEKNDEL